MQNMLNNSFATSTASDSSLHTIASVHTRVRLPDFLQNTGGRRSRCGVLLKFNQSYRKLIWYEDFPYPHRVNSHPGHLKPTVFAKSCAGIISAGMGIFSK